MITGSSSNPFQFTGRENDGTGLYYNRARYYSPTLGRFISQDPLGFAGGDPNLYGYVGNDPANLSDKTGKGFWTGLVVGAACGGYIIYKHYSNLAALNKLGQEQNQIRRKIRKLERQQKWCKSWEKQAEIQQQIEMLERRFTKLVLQYARAHVADSFADAGRLAGCVALTRLAFALPTP